MHFWLIISAIYIAHLLSPEAQLGMGIAAFLIATYIWFGK
jgi:hypothetical protein